MWDGGHHIFNNCLKIRSSKLGCLSTHTQTTGNNQLGGGKHMEKKGCNSLALR